MGKKCKKCKILLIFSCFGKNLGMDYVLLALVVFCGLRGIFKGALSMIFSLFGVVAIAFVAWNFCDFLVPVFSDLFGESLKNAISETLNGAISGEFSSMSELLSAISTSSIAKIFGYFLENHLGNISFEGVLTAGEILSPVLTSLALKILAFLALFLCLFLLLKIVFLLIKKFLQSFNLTGLNRVFGGLLGVLKGLVLFGILYFVLLSLSNFVLSEPLSVFLQNGVISTWLYENLFQKVVEFFV